MRTLSTWLLAGALAASLTWNWSLARSNEATDPGAGCGSAASCGMNAADLGLDPTRQAKLAELCATSCSESDRLERRADELQRALLESLAAPTIDSTVATRLVDEVSDLRRRSLASCVQGILGVRAVLSGEEVRAMLERCNAGPARCR